MSADAEHARAAFRVVGMEDMPTTRSILHTLSLAATEAYWSPPGAGRDDVESLLQIYEVRMRVWTLIVKAAGEVAVAAEKR